MSCRVGDKFIIEIGERYGNRMTITEDDLFRVKGFNSLVFDKNGLDKLQKYEEEVVATKFYEKGRKEALEEVQNCESYGYEKGLQDAWELAKKIALYDYETESGYTQSELKAIFNKTSLQGVFRSYTIQEALAKVEEVSKEEIKAGDFCIDKDGLEWLVTYVNKGTSKDDIDYHCMDKKGYTSPVLYHKGELNKTGKHLDISHLLEQIRGNE